MTKIKNVYGVNKIIFFIKITIYVSIHFLPELLKGKMSFTKYLIYLRRLLYFLSKMKHNKFVRIGENTRIDLYVPGFPSPAFYTACKKFKIFGEKLPCLTVLISVTRTCRYKCSHCYQKYDKGKDVDIDILVKTIKKLQDMGIAFFNIEGGEPFLVYNRLKEVCAAIDNRSEIWINSTGDGITIERLKELKENNVTAIMFSLHSPQPNELNNFMGMANAWETMERAVGICHQIEMPVAFNTCLQKDDFYNGKFEKIMNRAKEFNAAFIQLIKPKPAGGWLETGAGKFREKDLDYLKQRVNLYNHNKQYRDYPAISAQIIEEDKDVFGCTAGGTDRFYINAKGDVQPCEFLNLSFGNIMQEEFEIIYHRMRTHFEDPCECWLCEKYSGNILQIFKENKLTSLPLPPELSKLIYTTWNRGNKTKLYQCLKNLKK